MGTFNLAHGLGLFAIGCLVTVIGFYIAYTVASNAVHKANEANKKKEPSPLDGLLKYINNADDCQ